MDMAEDDDWKNITRLDHREHVLLRPDTYIGSVKAIARQDWIITEDWKAEVCNVEVAPGLLKCADEIVANAVDNGLRARRNGIAVPPVHITVSGWTVTVRNGGPPIPVVFNPLERAYVPSLIFGTLLTSSTYNDDSPITAGRNGYGAKLTNIYSTRFEVQIDDAARLKRFQQTWTDNMTIAGDPMISDLPATADSMVQVTYDIDRSRFQHLDTEEQYPQDFVGLMRMMAFSTAFTCQTGVVFDGRSLPRCTAIEYARAVFGNLPMMYWKTPINSATGLPTLQFVAVSVEHGLSLSFVNGNRTREGGVHVEYVFRRLHRVMMGVWKGASLAEIRNQIALVVVVSIAAPTFRGQMKDYYTGPEIPVDRLSKADLGPLARCERLARVFAARAKEQEKSQKTATNGSGPLSAVAPTKNVFVAKDSVRVDGLIDANLAGSARAKDCALVIIEGQSGMDYAMSLVSGLPGGRDRNGILEDSGVIINGYEDCDRVRKSRDYTRLSATLGPADKMRYGQVILMSDQDLDGARINALKIMILFRFYPQLVKGSRLYYCVTPLIRAGREVFYDTATYEAWAAEHPRHQARYMKGLGSNTRADAAQDVSRLKLVKLLATPDTEETLAMMFSKSEEHSLARTAHVLAAQAHKAAGESVTISLGPEYTISEYLRNEYTAYCVYNNVRSIPGIDGLRLAQRKIAWAAWKRWSPHNQPERGLRGPFKECKVAQLAGHVAETMGYHHDERLLQDGITYMTSRCVNNYPLFTGCGNFGTLRKGVAGASPGRYTSVMPSDAFSKLLPAALVPLVTLTRVENEDAEPEYLLPVVPLSVINGTRGLGTGFSTHIPPHHAGTVCEWLIARMDGTKRPLPRPHYVGFKGKCEVVPNRKFRVMDGCHFADDKLRAEGSRVLALEADWTITQVNNDGETVDLLVRDLPPTTTLLHYLEFLDGLVKDGLLTDYRDRSRITEEEDVMELHLLGVQMRKKFPKEHELWSRAPPSITRIPWFLNLLTHVSLENFYVVHPTKGMVHYASIEDILEDFFIHTMPYYDRLAQLEVRKLEQEVEALRQKRILINAVVTRTIDITASETVILRALADMGVPDELYRNAKMSQFRLEAVVELEGLQRSREDQLEAQRSITSTSLWKSDLRAFINHSNSLD